MHGFLTADGLSREPSIRYIQNAAFFLLSSPLSTDFTRRSGTFAVCLVARGVKEESGFCDPIAAVTDGRTDGACGTIHHDGDDDVCVRDGDESDDATDGFDEPTNDEDGGTDPSLL